MDSAKEVKISAVVITLNEERNIGRCIDSLIGIADEIVVVDSFSTDRTKEICEEKGVRFVLKKFEGHIEQKNYAISVANFPHILSLDADEALDENLKKSILSVKKNWNYDGYSMNRLTNYCGKWIRHTDWYPDVKLRLWDSRKGKWGGVNPHDEFYLESGSTKSHIKGDILHYSYYSIFDHLKQVNYFTEIMAKTNYEAGKRSNLFKILFSPVFKFIKSYFIRLGFLDGFYGFIVCAISAQASFIKYVKIREYQKRLSLEK